MEDVDQTYMAQDRDQWWMVFNVVMDHCVA